MQQHKGQTEGSEACLCIWYKEGDRSVHQQMCQAKQEAISDVLLVMWEGWTQEGGVFARDKSRSMAKKVNKTCIKPRGLERCS